MAQTRFPRIAALGALLFAFLIQAALADDRFSRQVNFDIAAQTVESALIEFSKQADVQVMVGTLSLNGQKTEGVKGTLTVTQALEHLLKDTGLEYQTKGNTVTVRSVKNARADAVVMPLVDGVRLASSDARGEAARNGEAPRARESAEPEVETLAEVVVTGSHIRGQAGPVGARLLTIDRKEIDRSGFATAQEIIRALPQNFSGGPSEDTNVGLEAQDNFTRGASVNLRGLGAGSTLVLINGRRLAAAGIEGRFVDVSSIPLSAIERVEVLTDGASAIYGSDAVGGVVNFITRRDYSGAETQLRYGSVTDGDLRQLQASQLLGTSWDGGNVMAAYEFQHRDSMPASARELSASSDLRRFGGENFDSEFSNPGNIDDGFDVWAIPSGQDGRSLQVGDLVQGGLNLRNTNENRDLYPEQRKHSGFVSMSQQLGILDLSADVMYTQRDAQVTSPNASPFLTVTSENPFYIDTTGFGDEITVIYNLTRDLGPLKLEAQTKTLSAGVSGTFPVRADWKLTFGGLYGRERGSQAQRNSANADALDAALLDPDPSTAFNPFGDGSFTNPATIEAIRGTNRFAADSDVKEGTVNLSGGLLDLPGGRLRLAIGADYREQELESQSIEANGFASDPSRLSRTVKSAYAEIAVPFFSSTNRRNGAERLELSLAGRYDDYDDFGSTVNPKIGLNWMPILGLSLHGTWGTSFKAPNLADLDETNNFSFIVNAVDPQASTPTGRSPVLFWSGRNADLSEETASVWSAGISWSPEFASRPRVDLTYFNIQFEDRIEQTPFNFAILSDEARFAGIITRQPTQQQRQMVCSRSTFTGLNQADCLNRPVAAIVDFRTVNTAITENSGLDLTGSLEINSSWGTFEANVNATYILDFSRAQTPTSDLFSLLDTVTNPLRFRMRDSLSWRRGPFTIAGFVNYVGGYTDDLSTPERKVNDWTTMDLQLSYETDPSAPAWLANTWVALNLQNAFDEDPPFVNNPSGFGYDRENADLLGRVISLQIRRTW